MRHPMQRHLEALFRRMQHAFRVGYTSTTTTDDGAAQGVQVRFHELSTQDQVWLGQHYGHGSNPPVGTRVVVLGGHGDPTSAVAVSTNHEPSRYKGSGSGHSWIDDASGSRLLLTNDTNATLTLAGTFTIKIGGMMAVFSETGLAITGGAITATGEVTAKAGALSVSLSTHKGHGPGTSPPTPGT